jgi:hypothetical protein
MSMRRGLAFAVFSCLAASCGTSGGTARLPAYLVSEECNGLEEAACTAAGCEWLALGAVCPEGVDCPAGVCVAPDPCRVHGDPESCLADAENGCAWAGIEALSVTGAPDGEGVCYQAGDDCVCACPVYCPEGEECPPCDCDCGSSSGGGGTCTCACPDCPEGEVCPPCECDCTEEGCVEEGTCTCACPACPEGEECPPCECDCDPTTGGGEEPVGEPSSCVCPDCPEGEECPPCECPEADPCLAHADEAACLADTDNQCTWLALGMPCVEGETCAAGVCQAADSGGDGCVCVCPDCQPDQTCPPCACDCGGGGDDCVPGTSEPGAAE